jgi:DNA repair protein RadC
MHDVLPDDRPREKLERYGVRTLGDNELLAVLIGHGSAGHRALAVANTLLADAGGVQGLAKLHHRVMTRHAGIGAAQASRIQAAVELGRRTLTRPVTRRLQFLTARDVAAFLLPRFGAHVVEQVGVVLLDARHRLVATRVISIGSVDQSLAQPRDVFREAMLAGAPAVVVFHNHPSGDPTPSDDDVALTLRIKRAGSIVGVELLDHVILGDTGYFSMKEQRLI